MHWLKQALKVLGYTMLGVLLVIAGLAIYLKDVSLGESDETMHKRFGKFGKAVQVIRYKQGTRPMRYLKVGADSCKTAILFIHGAPSSLMGWGNFLEDSLLQRKAQLLAVDRPGYGQSGFGVPELDIAKQAHAIAPILQSVNQQGRKLILVGSSYGGPVCAALAMFYPDMVSQVVFVSGSTAPGLEMTYPITYLISRRFIRSIIPSVLNVATTEKLNHYHSLKALEPFWPQITAPCLVIHGTSDDLIYYGNAWFTTHKLENSKHLQQLTLKGDGHYLPWSRTSLIKHELHRLVREGITP